MKVLTEQCLLQFFLVAKVRESKQLYLKPHNFQLCPPRLEVECPASINEGSNVKVKLKFKNVLFTSLSRLLFLVQAQGLCPQREIVYRFEQLVFFHVSCEPRPLPPPPQTPGSTGGRGYGWIFHQGSEEREVHLSGQYELWPTCWCERMGWNRCCSCTSHSHHTDHSHQTEHPHKTGHSHQTEHPHKTGHSHQTEHPHKTGHSHQTEHPHKTGHSHHTEHPHKTGHSHMIHTPSIFLLCAISQIFLKRRMCCSKGMGGCYGDVN